MTYEAVTVLCGGGGPWISDGKPGLGTGARAFDNRNNVLSPCAAYQQLLETSANAEIIAYIHDDVTIHDPEWLQHVIAPFGYSGCVAVGLGGATALGRPNLYKERWNIWNMARSGYASNQTDAEVHGERFTWNARVAVLDAFFMAVRTDWLRSVGGWPVDHLSHHCLDLWLACMAARHKKEIWMAGVSCTHHGGGTSTKPIYQQAKWLKGKSIESDHLIPHRWLYEEFKDVLPLRV